MEAAFLPAVGTKVAVKTALGDERVVRVAAHGNGVVYVTTEAEYERAHAQGESPEPMIGYPVEDVREI